MASGSIYFKKDFKYADGESSDKLFLMINDPSTVSKNSVYICLTTSKEKAGRTRRPGCAYPPNHSHYLEKQKDSFDSDTWFVFPELIEIDGLKFMQESIDKTHIHKFDLKKDNFRSVLNCILNSHDLTLMQHKVVKDTLKKLNTRI